MRGVGGTWKDLTDNVNSMASNLTSQVRSIAKVVTAVAGGELKRKLVLEAKGEIAELAETINGMIDTLLVFADQVTTVAREVGIEGKLGGQANVPGAAGRWRDLTDNVNQLAGNLTTQVRAIADVATAVTQGDLTRSIAVQAAGEVASLKDNINEMIRNLKDTTRKNTEQDWLKTNLAKFTRMLQGQRDLLSVGKQILSELSPLVSAQHSVFYVVDNSKDDITIRLLASYAYKERKHLASHFKVGEGLVGQCVLEKQAILVTDVPPNYIRINSGLGELAPANIIVLPVVFEGEVKAVIELGSFNRFTDVHLSFLEQLTESIAIVLNTITATTRTEDLLKQSQSLTEELRSQQEELTETNKRLEQQAQNLQQSEELLKTQQRELQTANDALEERAKQLALQNSEVEEKNHEVETAKKLLEEKAEQLALTSRFKSEFLANMSHELRTPLNSLLILSEILSQNDEHNLSSKQKDYVQTIHSAGTDLFDLINDILDLAKIESGTMSVEIDNIPFNDIREFVTRTFRQVAESKKLIFDVTADKRLPKVIHTDGKRLQQVLKNLLSNAFKFTAEGKVALHIALLDEITFSSKLLRSGPVAAFIVSDSGIGIPKDKHQIIFEAFQQADGTTSRKYGGTGLGLSISRQIAQMLGGEIHLESEVDKGSRFTLYLPLKYTPQYGIKSLTSSVVTKDAKQPSKEIQEKETIESHAIYTHNGIKPLLLIVEHNPSYSRVLQEVAKDNGFDSFVIDRAHRVLPLVKELKPAAILLDTYLPDGNAWVILDCLKQDNHTRHIPVQVISNGEKLPSGTRTKALAIIQKTVKTNQLQRAIDQFKSVLERSVKKIVLLATENAQQDLLDSLQHPSLEIIAEQDGEKILSLLEKKTFDAVIIDVGRQSKKENQVLKKILIQPQLKKLPVIVLNQHKSVKKKNSELDSLINKNHIHSVNSLEELFNKVSLMMHLTYHEMSEQQRGLLEKASRLDPHLAQQKILIVDDDIRNIFALSSALERYHMKVLFAENGRAGIEILQKKSDIGIVLMDIMMPGMDGYETIQEIRKLEGFEHLPIIALTAKAMKDDRERCLKAGANDYLIKPVNTEQLLSTLRVWLQYASEPQETLSSLT